jgi:hypothetical protein
MCVTGDCPFMVRKIGATVLVALKAHHTPTVASFSRTSWIYLENLLTRKFTSPLNWSQDSLPNRTSVEYLSPLCTPWQSCFTISVTEIMNHSCLMWSKLHICAVCLFLLSREELVARKISKQIYVALPVAAAFCILFWAVSDIRKSWDPLPLQTHLAWTPHTYELAGISVSAAWSVSSIDISKSLILTQWFLFTNEQKKRFMNLEPVRTLHFADIYIV